MGLIGCPEESARNYHYMLHNDPEECKLKMFEVWWWGRGWGEEDGGKGSSLKNKNINCMQYTTCKSLALHHTAHHYGVINRLFILSKKIRQCQGKHWDQCLVSCKNFLCKLLDTRIKKIEGALWIVAGRWDTENDVSCRVVREKVMYL